jgi:hypothetical protein
MHLSSTLLRRAVLGAAGAAACSLALAATASADPVDVTCVTSADLSFSPGLTFATTPTSITTAGQLGPCVSVSDPTVTSGTHGSTFSRTTSCVGLLNTGPGTRVFHWSNGQTSSFTFSSTSTYVAGQLVTTLRGTITAGEFAGSSAVQVATFAADLTKCLQPGGLTGATGVGNLTIYL